MCLCVSLMMRILFGDSQITNSPSDPINKIDFTNSCLHSLIAREMICAHRSRWNNLDSLDFVHKFWNCTWCFATFAKTSNIRLWVSGKRSYVFWTSCLEMDHSYLVRDSNTLSPKLSGIVQKEKIHFTRIHRRVVVFSFSFYVLNCHLNRMSMLQTLPPRCFYQRSSLNWFQLSFKVSESVKAQRAERRMTICSWMNNSSTIQLIECNCCFNSFYLPHQNWKLPFFSRWWLSFIKCP